ncbi:MAG: PIG-L family deacetylase [Brevefilum sp.]|nr:PIG-L family deacetylase [Brevefilum sp.]MDW7754599.1 PIG-L family deacetylase [Brevefilum sp.]
MEQEQWIFLSPHFDDVALSCGGLVWELTNQGDQVEVWTIMAGFPPDENFSAFAQKNHYDWGKSGHEAIQMRREEDKAACSILGAIPKHFDCPDVIYRKHPESGLPVVNNNDELFNEQPEKALVNSILSILTEKIPPQARVVLPMGLGGHLDHRTLVKVGEGLDQEKLCYADYPYILNSFDSPILTENKYKKIPCFLSPDALTAWQEGVLSYRSQLAAFWRDDDEARLSLQNYLAGGGGRLWKKN